MQKFSCIQTKNHLYHLDPSTTQQRFREGNSPAFFLKSPLNMTVKLRRCPLSQRANPSVFSWIMFIRNQVNYAKWTGKRVDSMNILTKKGKTSMKPYPKHIYL